MRKNEKSRQGIEISNMQARKKAKGKEFINQIIEEIREKCSLPDSEIQEYEEKLLRTLDDLVKQFDEKDEFNLKIVSAPHEYARIIQGTNGRLIEYKGYYCEEEEIRKRRIIGDAKVEETAYGLEKSDFSLADIQTIITQQTIYSGKVRSFDFERTYKRKRFYNILVYIPKEIEEKENGIKTYQELVHQEKRQEIEDKIKQNEQEVVEQIMLTIRENYELSDSSMVLMEEYRKKIQEAVKLSNADIEYLVAINRWSDRKNGVKIKIVRDPYEYNKALLSKEYIDGEYDYNNDFQISSIIGDVKTSRHFSIGRIQVCSKNYEGQSAFHREILLYIPEREFCEEQLKKGIKTYQELLNKDKEEHEAKTNELAKIFRNKVATQLKDEVNENLTQEQIETILNHIDFRFRAEYYIDEDENEDNYPYPINITSNPDEFVKHLVYDIDNGLENEKIIGDSISGYYRYAQSKHITCKMPNFSLNQIQAIKGIDICSIYIPEREYEEKDYQELIKRRFVEKLKEKAEGKITDEDVNSIAEGIDINFITNTEIELISNPFEYGKKLFKDENNKIKSIFGDTKLGEYEYSYLEEYDYSEKKVKTMPDFNVGRVQATILSTYDLWDNIRIGSKLYIYVPEREYEEKDYEELVHKQKRDKIVETIKQESGNKLDMEEIKQIADEIADKIEMDAKVEVSMSPYKYGEMIDDDKCRIDNLLGNTTDDEYNNYKDFSLNMLQLNKIQEIYSEYGIVNISNERYCIYLPDEEYKKCKPEVTYQYLLWLDRELEKARDLANSCGNLYGDKEHYEKLLAEKQELFGQEI